MGYFSWHIYRSQLCQLSVLYTETDFHDFSKVRVLILHKYVSNICRCFPDYQFYHKTEFRCLPLIYLGSLSYHNKCGLRTSMLVCFVRYFWSICWAVFVLKLRIRFCVRTWCTITRNNYQSVTAVLACEKDASKVEYRC